LPPGLDGLDLLRILLVLVFQETHGDSNHAMILRRESDDPNIVQEDPRTSTRDRKRAAATDGGKEAKR
jgi:hypothetical protein